MKVSAGGCRVVRSSAVLDFQARAGADFNVSCGLDCNVRVVGSDGYLDYEYHSRGSKNFEPTCTETVKIVVESDESRSLTVSVS